MVSIIAICLSVLSMVINAFTIGVLIGNGRALDRAEATNEREA